MSKIIRTSYRSIDFNDERKWKHKHPNDDVNQVGIQKAIGHICNDRNKFDSDGIKELQLKFLESGKFTHLKFDRSLYILHVGDKDWIQKILNINVELINQHKLNCDAEWFFNYIANNQIWHDEFLNEIRPENKIVSKDLYHMICELFNSWCLWCEPRIWHIDDNGTSHLLSADPYDPDLKV